MYGSIIKYKYESIEKRNAFTYYSLNVFWYSKVAFNLGPSTVEGLFIDLRNY